MSAQTSPESGAATSNVPTRNCCPTRRAIVARFFGTESWSQSDSFPECCRVPLRLVVSNINTSKFPTSIAAFVVSKGVEFDAGPAAHDMAAVPDRRSEEHTSELQSQSNLVCRLLLEKKKKKKKKHN